MTRTLLSTRTREKLKRTGKISPFDDSMNSYFTCILSLIVFFVFYDLSVAFADDSIAAFSSLEFLLFSVMFILRF